MASEGQWFRQCEGPDRLERLGLGGRGDVGAAAVGVHRDVRNRGGVDVTCSEDAVDLAVGRWRGSREARIAGEREFDCGRGELASDVRRIGVADDAPEQGARGLLRVRVRMVGARQRPLELGRLDRQARLELAAHQVGLGVDVQTGEHEGGRIAEAADAVQRHLERRRRGSPLTPLMRTRSGPSCASEMLSTRSVTSGLA